MKIRNGFVSNSSTSSYIVIGSSFTEEQLEKEFGKSWVVEFEKHDLFYEYYEENCIVVGKLISRICDDEFVYDEISFNDMNSHAKNMSDMLNIKIDEVKLIVFPPSS